MAVDDESRKALEATLKAVQERALKAAEKAEKIKQIADQSVAAIEFAKAAVATIKLLNNRVYARELGSNVREKVLKMMDPFILNEHERDQYNKLLNN